MTTTSNNGNESGEAVTTTINGGFTFEKDTIWGLKLEEKLGKGSCGTVWKVVSEETDAVYALKIVSKKSGDTVQKEFLKEVNVLKSLDHENILGMHGWFQDEENLYLVLDCAETDLFAFDPEDWEPEWVKKYIREALSGLAYLHDRFIVHCDFKAHNLLRLKNGRVVVADLGSCHVGTDLATRFVGTPPYMAPEVLRIRFGSETERLVPDGYHSPVDIWALGVQVFYMLTGDFPYGQSTKTDEGVIVPETDGEKLLKDIESKFKSSSDIFANMDKVIPNPAKNFVRKLLTVDPKDRMTAAQALEHPWITGKVSSIGKFVLY